MNPLSSSLIDPPEVLLGQIMQHIERLEARQQRARFWLSFVIFALSTVGGWIVTGWAIQDMRQTGFGEFVSLIFTNASILSQSGKELGLALLETLPALSFSLGGLLLIALCWSGRSLFKYRLGLLRLRQTSL